MTNGDIIPSETFKIEPVHAYAKDYTECIEEAKKEQRENSRPEIKSFPKSLEEYDVIYLGYPNYWGTMPMPMFTFLEKMKLENKVIKPFCSQEGSGLGRSQEDIQKLCPHCKVEKGLAIHGANIVEEQLKEWVEIAQYNPFSSVGVIPK